MADVPFRAAEWFNSDSSTVNTFVGEACVQCLNTKEHTELIPVVARLKQFVETNDEIHKLFKQAFQELPSIAPYDKDPIGNPQIRDFDLFLVMLNVVLSSPPRFEKHDYVGLPISAMLNWITYTPSGLVLFANAELNAHIKDVLDHWSVFLSSPESLRYLTTEEGNGWFSPAAVSKCVGANNQVVPFEDLYECDPSKPYFGFTSWDAYFTRLFKPGQRPVVDADNDSIIMNACESCPYKLATHVKLDDQFWIKGQPYSLRHMLQDEALASYFAGGTVYQAYLSSMSYHRWHCPVNGRVKAIKMILGAYFANCPSIGYDPTICDSQSYQTEVSTRCLIYIESINAAIGLMCFVAIGMGEVSTCEVTVKVGDTLKKGDELGLFHFGGSSHCLIFGPQVNLKFKFGPDDKIGLGSTIQLLNINLAEVL